MDLTTLPDRGAKLRNRLDKLEEDVKIQEQKVADMVVDPSRFFFHPYTTVGLASVIMKLFL